MTTSTISKRLAVCSWSVQPATLEHLFQSLDAIGVRRVQLALDPLREKPEVWGNFGAEAAQRGVAIVSGMFGTVGEDYTTLDTIKATGGVVPDATWDQNWRNIQQIVAIAQQLGLKIVTFHAGFLPHEESDPSFTKLFARISRIADLFSQRGISLGFETGQETADTLGHFLQKLNRPTVGVNFDPANMILYAKGDPIAALRTLAPWLKQCHIKDANLTKVPGTWGEEVVVGTGQVDWKAFFAALRDVKFTGDLCIEREAGNQRVTDICAAKDYVSKTARVARPRTPRAPQRDLRTVNVGVIGLGFMGLMHIKSYRQLAGARLAAVSDAFKQPVNGVIPGIGGNIAGADALQLDPTAKFYKDWKDLLADPDVELVDICVPTPDHVAISVAALQAGKHVICEKPLARTSALCREIVAAVAGAKGYFMPAMCMRFWPGWDWLKQAIDAQTYGKVLAARFRRVCGPPGWSRANYFKGADSGGALLDLHIHDTDFVQFCFGRPKSVFSTGLTRFSGAIDHVVTQYQVANGAIVSAEGSWVMSGDFPFTMAYTVNFERATADFDIARGPEALRLYEDGKPVQTVNPPGVDGYVGELTHIVESVASGRPPTVVTAKDGLSAVEICEAEEKSIQLGQPVSL